MTRYQQTSHALPTQHRDADAAVEGEAGALRHEDARRAPHAHDTGVHRQPQPQRVQRVRQLQDVG
jgi:hypothetical protein